MAWQRHWSLKEQLAELHEAHFCMHHTQLAIQCQTFYLHVCGLKQIKVGIGVQGALKKNVYNRKTKLAKMTASPRKFILEYTWP